jgi:hypothetical protein
MSNHPPDDPVPLGVVLDLDESFCVLEALEAQDMSCVIASRRLAYRMSSRRSSTCPRGRFGLDQGRAP